MFALGRFAVRFRWLIILAWIVILALGVVFAPKLGGELSSGGWEVPDVESTRARNLLETEFTNQNPANLTIIYHSDTLKVTEPAFQRVVTRSSKELAKDSRVDTVLTFYNTGSPQFVSEDKDTTYALVNLKGEMDEAIKVTPRLIKKARDNATSKVKIAVTGAPAIWNDFSEISQKDLSQAEMLGLPISIILLILAFGSLIAAGMPIILGLIGLTVGFSILYFIAQQMELNIYVQNAAAMIGLGLGIDYSLFIVTRFREELRNNTPTKEAVAKTIGTAGKAVFFSGLSLIVAISGLWLVKMQVFHSFAVGIAVVAAVTVLAALTLLPALLSLLGKRVNSLRLPIPGISREDGKWWHRWALVVMRRPIIFFLLALALLLAFAVPALNLKLGQAGIEVVPKNVTSRQGFELLKREFGAGELASIPIIIKKEGILEPNSLKNIKNLGDKLEEEDEVSRVDGLFSIFEAVKPASLPPGIDLFQLYSSLAYKNPRYNQLLSPFVNLDRGGDVTIIRVTPKRQAQHRATEELVTKIREEIIPSVNGLSSNNVFVGGATAENIDFNSEIIKSFPRILGFVFLLTYIILLILFRSLILPLKAIITDALSVAGAYGLLVLIFQYGVGDSILGFEAAGFVGNFTPIFLFALIFGLSMDYEVFLLSRVKENYDKTKENKESVALGLERTGRIITSAALIMITIFAAFGLTKLVPIKEVGIGMAIAIFLDATLVRVVLVPATMQLLGRWNWWLPRPLAKILPKVSSE